jgi:multiple sugar transport system substrate-binding protein
MEGELRIDALQGAPVEPVLDLLTSAITGKYPKVSVKLEYISGDRAEGAYAKAAAGTLADVIFSADLWVVPFAKQGVTLDIKPLADADTEWDINDVIPSMLGLGTFNGEVHMIPSSLDVVTMYYNIDLFEKAGAEVPTATWTWDDFITNTKKITEMEKDSAGLPTYYGLSNATWNWWATYYPWIVGYGGKILDAGKTTWTDPKTIEGITAYTDLWTKHNVAQPLGLDVGGDAFQLGRAAIWTHIPGQRGAVRTNVADKFKWDCQLLPLMPDGKHRTGMGAWGLSVYGQSKMPELAYQYVRNMCTQPIQLLMAKKELGTPLVKSVANDTKWMEGLPTPPENYAAFVKGAEDAVLPVMDYPADCGSFYAGQIAVAINTALENILRGVMGVEEALAEIDSEIGPCLAENS